MTISIKHTHSQAFFENESEELSLRSFFSLKGRGKCFLSFFQKLAILPFALLAKAAKTALHLFGVGVGMVKVVITFGTSVEAKRYFIEKASQLGADIGDWFLFPIALVLCFVKMALGALIHPAIYLS